MKQCLFLLIFVLLGALEKIAAQQKNTNEVTTIKVQAVPDSTPVAGAVIFIKGVKLGQTEDNGCLNLEPLYQHPYADLSVLVEGKNYKLMDGQKHRHGDTLFVFLPLKVHDIDEVFVNTGYQRIGKGQSTGAYSVIDDKTLQMQPSVNIVDRLDGVAPAILFSGKADGPKFTIRGLGTINGPKDPLVIVDNFPYEGNLANINPNDVESITLLKDAAASSIWGARAGNGVVVITLKKGKYDHPTSYGVNVSEGHAGKPNLYNLPQISSRDYIEVEKMLYAKGFFGSTISSPDHKALTPVIDLLDQNKRGLLALDDLNKSLEQSAKKDLRNDYSKHVYNDPVTRQYAVNVSGGSSNSSYYLFGSYNHQLTDLRAKNNKVNFGSRVDLHPLKAMEIGISLTYTGYKSESGQEGYGSLLINGRRVPYLSLLDDNGQPEAVATDYRKSYTDTAGAGLLLPWDYRPLTDWKHNRTEANSNDLLMAFRWKYSPAQWITLQAQYGYEQQKGLETTVRDTASYYTRKLVNQFTSLNRTTNTVTYNVPVGAILDRSYDDLFVHNGRIQMNISKSWGAHSLDLLSGWEVRQSVHKGNSDRYYGYAAEYLTTANVNYKDQFTDYVSGGTSLIPNGRSLTKATNRFVSVFGNLMYAFKNTYRLTFSARRDASNLFGVSTNDKWTPLWSIGGSWELTREQFFHSQKIQLLKFRATFGYSGNVDQSKTALTTIQHIGPYVLTNLDYARISNFYNPSLRWEKVATTDFGMDFSLLGHISGNLDYYKKKASDLYGPMLVDYTAGLGTDFIVGNVANVTEKGWELNLSSINVLGPFKWKTSLLANYTKSTVTSFYRATSLAQTIVNDGTTIHAVKGYPLYSIFSYVAKGLDQDGNPKGLLAGAESTNYASILNSTDFSSISYDGPALPPFYGSLGNDFSFRNFGIYVNISYRLGYYFRRPTINYGSLFNNGIGHPDFSLRWQSPGDEKKTDIPSMVYPSNGTRDDFYTHSSSTVEKGDNIRLQFVNLYYNGKYRVRNHENNYALTLNVSNIGILWRANKKNLDPDYMGTLSPARQYTLSLSLTF